MKYQIDEDQDEADNIDRRGGISVGRRIRMSGNMRKVRREREDTSRYLRQLWKDESGLSVQEAGDLPEMRTVKRCM